MNCSIASLDSIAVNVPPSDKTVKGLNMRSWGGYNGSLGEVDSGRTLGNNSFMQVTLCKELEDFIAEKVRHGGYANADEVVGEALRELKAKDDPAEIDSQELAELLLAAVRGSHRPLTGEHFDQLRARAQGPVAA
jgi:putative addiction module CopG family antidote